VRSKGNRSAIVPVSNIESAIDAPVRRLGSRAKEIAPTKYASGGRVRRGRGAGGSSVDVQVREEVRRICNSHLESPLR
jgi:hypothetical protein